MERFADLDELVVGCRTPAAKGYIAEAVAAYRAGAFRASVTATYVAVVFDLIDKIRELAISGNPQAKLRVASLENIQSQIDRNDPDGITGALKLERGILEQVRDEFQLLDHQQYTDMDRLKHDRNRCAHPSFLRTGLPYHPPAEAVRTHLRNAMVHVLHLPPIQGKAALAEIEMRVSSAYFPSSREEAVINLRDSSLGRSTDSLVCAVIDRLVHGFFEPGSAFHKSKTVAAGIGATIDLSRAVALPRAISQLQKVALQIADADMETLVELVSVIPETWCELSDPARMRVEGFVRNGPVSESAKFLAYALGVAGLKDVARVRIGELDREGLEVAIAAGVRGEAVERAVELYTHVHSWTGANSVARNIVIPLLDELTREHVERILRAPTEHGADLLGSTAFGEFLSGVREGKTLSGDELDELLIDNNLSSYASDEAQERL